MIERYLKFTILILDFPLLPQSLFKRLALHLHNYAPIQIPTVPASRVLLQELRIAVVGLQLRPCRPVLTFPFQNDAFLVEGEILFR